MAPNFKRIVITSIPGSDFDETTNEFYVDSLKNRLQTSYGFRSEIFSVRDLIYRFARQENINLDPSKIHNFSSDKKIRLLRQLAFVELDRQLLSREANGEGDIALITTRATSFSAHGKEESLSRRYLEAIKPDLLVVVIDDPAAIYNRIPKHESTHKYARLEIDELVLWMENEVSDMQELANELNCRLFVMPKRQVGALAALIATDKKPAYVSYAMTGASPQVKRQKDLFVKMLQEHFVVFDPECMGSAHTATFMTNEQQRFYRDDVILRDEQWFIDINSEYVIVYLPEKGPAHGSQSELHTGSEECKTVFVVLEPSYTDATGRLTPFIDRRAGTVFISSDEFRHYLSLSAEEQRAYAQIRELMWSFKRNGKLAGLINNSPTAPFMTEDELFKEYAQECTTSCKQLISRGVLPEISDAAVLKIAEDCWNFNRVLWSDPRPQSNVERLPLQYPTQRVRQKAARRTSPTALAHDPIVEPRPKQGLTDRQLFYAVFQDGAATEEGHAFFEKLTTFFRDEHLDNFEQHQDFLEFLRKQPEELLQIDLRDCLRRYFDEKGAAA